MWGHRENTPGAVTAASLARQIQREPQSYPPQGMFVAFGPEGEPAGFCRGEAGQPAEPGGPILKLVDGPGVAPAHRSQRLQRPLVLTVMRWLSRQGPGAYDLQSWGDTPETIELYRELGFDVAGHWMEYRLDLRQAT
jgi:GNAT superfamily N-acetyltransferase